MLARKAAAALASGCTFIAKPAEDTPYSALALAQLAAMAGLPPGAINIITCSRTNAPEIGRIMCEHTLIRKISFTGSTLTGKVLISQSASTVKKLSLELGGNAPFIIFNSADLHKSASGLVAAKFRNTGQTCISANRVLVQSQIHDSFVSELKAQMSQQLVVGNGFESNTTQGPLINQKGYEKVNRLVQDAVQKGATLVMGGRRCSHLEHLGYFYEPTILTGVDSSMDIYSEEIFGPVVSIIK
jgi:acyl-CoA reductase-like NAD-dependent aldehyde dehydrogenase